MAGASLAGKLPDGPRNGLEAIAGDLIADPRKVRVVVALVDCQKITTKTDTAEVIPTARVRAIEVITEDDLRVARTLMSRALDKRMGQEALPFELEEEIRAAFGDDEDHGPDGP